MDTGTPPNLPHDARPSHRGAAQDSHDPLGQRRVLSSAYDSASILANDTDSVQTGRQLTDGDSIQTAHSEGNLTSHLTYETDSNRTLNPAFDTDSTRTLHPAYVGGDGADPPPYSPPDPKTAYLVYPSAPPLYPTQPVLTCQPGPGPPAFYQPPFLPPSTFPSYTIYMNGAPLGDEQPPLPKDYLLESLLVTVFCCLMSGLVAVMYAFETRAALARGDVRHAEKTSQKTRVLLLFSLMFGVFMLVGWLVYLVIALCE